MFQDPPGRKDVRSQARTAVEWAIIYKFSKTRFSPLYQLRVNKIFALDFLSFWPLQLFLHLIK